MSHLENKAPMMVGSGIVAGFLASGCCVGPLVLTTLGIGGAATLNRFVFLRIPLIFLVVGLFGVAGYYLFQKRHSCDPGSICSDPKKYRLMVLCYFMGLIMAIVGITSQYWVSWLV